MVNFEKIIPPMPAFIKYLGCLAAFIVNCFFCKAQSSYFVTHLDNTKGLSNNSVKNIFQDSDQLLWVSTSDGLNVYNGSTFQLFKSDDQGNSFKLPDNIILNVREDKKKQIWICSEKGVTCYNKGNGALRHYFYNDEQNRPNGSADYFLTISNTGSILSGLRLDSVLYIYNERLQVFQTVKFDVGSIGMVAEIGFDDQGRLWTLSIGGVLRVFSQKGAYFHQVNSYQATNGIHLFYVVNHRIFYTTGSHTLHEITSDLHDQVIVTLPRLVNAIQYYEGHYFVAYTYKGLQEFDSDFKLVQNIVKDNPNLNQAEITSLLTSTDNVLWVSTAGNGVFKIVKNQNNFGIVNLDPLGGQIHSAVTAIEQVNKEIWVGTKSSGILRYPYRNNDSKAGGIVNPVSAFYDPVFNSYYSIKTGFDGNVYIGSDAFGLTIYDPLLNKFIKWGSVNGTNFNKDFFRVFSILPARDSSLYIGYLHGLIHLKVLRSASGDYRLVYFNTYKNASRFLNLGNNAIAALLQKDDWLLMGYQYAGLVLMNTKTGKTINILNKNDKRSLSSNNITSLYTDSSGWVWIGTDFGLNRIRFKDIFQISPQFQTLSMQNGLPDNSIHAITEGKDHMIWASTNRGLAKINPNTLKVIEYRVEDGLQNDEFTDGAVCKDSSGQLYFGGIAGFNHFDPGKIAVNNELPNLLVSDLKFGDHVYAGIRLKVFKPFGTNVLKQYRVERDQNFFHLRLESANGFANTKFRLKYLLKGFDNQWRDLNNNNYIDYSSLSAGHYDFFVQWSNGQGEWTAKKNLFRLTVAPHILWSAPAQVIYWLIFSAIIYGIYIFRKKRLEIKNKLFVENLIRIEEQRLYEEKVNFFTNITHELQTPLTLILGAIERFFHQSKDHHSKGDRFRFLRIANQEAFRLQYLVHQLLEFRKAESGHSKVSLDTFNASNLIKNIAELFGPIKEQKLLNFSLSVDPDMIICSDKDKFEKIIFNLFSNAFKHSLSGESIKSQAALVEGRFLELSISNSGFTPNQVNLSFLFEQFYTLDHNDKTKESSGIGLALTKQLTEILGGNISATAQNGWINFHIQLPVNKKAGHAIVEDEVQTISDTPSYLVRSIVESMEMTESTVNENNDLALIENLESPGRKSVLIVEDDTNIRLLLNELLQEEYVVYEAENGKYAIDLLKRIIPNLILSDVLMSDMDGISLCSLVKNNAETCHIPFLLLSARNAAEHKIEGFEAGADAYITKPYSPASLLKKIKELINYRENILQFLTRDQYYQTVTHSGLKTEDQTFLNKIIEVIREHMFDVDLDASVLEKALSQSRMSFHRKLKTLTNMTPSEFIRHIRLRHAASLLQTTHLTVSEIYFQSGFNNQSYFYREFKKMFHKSPKEFREQTKIKS